MADDIQKSNRDLIVGIKDKSEDNFEKNLVYMTAGTLVLSLTFIEKIAPLQNVQEYQKRKLFPVHQMEQ
jgi:hypothetical protein